MTVMEHSFENQRMHIYQNFMPLGVSESTMMHTMGYQQTNLLPHLHGHQPVNVGIYPGYPLQTIPGGGWPPTQLGVQQPQMNQEYYSQIPVNFILLYMDVRDISQSQFLQ